ncbi:hypothetical protein ACH5RR_006234 [Cinchona calisaya]|uniref:Uncharacterized protein n=1 Tax=Cinchona calisaya TaxID=153742 RepID=A0ABD3ANS2_9GENT
MRRLCVYVLICLETKFSKASLTLLSSGPRSPFIYSRSAAFTRHFPSSTSIGQVSSDTQKVARNERILLTSSNNILLKQEKHNDDNLIESTNVEKQDAVS